MAVLSNQKSKLKLVHSVENDEGVMVQKSVTYSNIKPGVTDDAILAGANALSPLLADEPIEVRRIDEAVVSDN